MFDKNEHLYIHNLNQSIEVETGGLQRPLSIIPRQSIKAFNFKGKQRNLLFQTRYPKTDIIYKHEQKSVPQNLLDCLINQNLRKKIFFGLNPTRYAHKVVAILYMAIQSTRSK